LLTAMARYCLFTAAVPTDMEAIVGAEPSGAPRGSLAFRVAYNGVYSAKVLPAFSQYIGRLHKWRIILVYKAPFQPST
jgi:hypothetical protein